EIDALCRAEGAQLRAVKQRLAFEATRLAHGHEAAQQAQQAPVQAFGGGDDWSAVPAAHVGTEPIKLVDLVTHDAVKAFPSKRQARQRIESGAVKLDGEVRSDPNEELRPASFPAEGLRLQAGRRCRFRLLPGDEHHWLRAQKRAHPPPAVPRSHGRGRALVPLMPPTRWTSQAHRISTPSLRER